MRAIWAIIPIKDLSLAKQRLSGMLSHAERRALGLAMLEDVLEALSKTPGLSGIVLASSDRDACHLARQYGARILPETGAGGLNPAVTHAARLLASENIAGALVLHGDVPLARAEEIARLIAALGPSPAIAMAPDAAHDGTNAMIVSPPDLIAFRYGRNSFSTHMDEAANSGVTPQVLDLAGLAFDVDTVDDLFTLAEAPGHTRAQEYLRTLRLNTKMPIASAQAR